MEKRTLHKPAQNELDRRFQAAVQKIARLCQNPSAQTPDGLDAIQIALEELPLTAEEFQLAMNRLVNARHYQQREETNAAIFETKMLLGLVRRCQTAMLEPDRRRIRFRLT